MSEAKGNILLSSCILGAPIDNREGENFPLVSTFVRLTAKYVEQP